VARPGGELAVAQGAQFAAQRLPRDSDTELLPQPLTEIDQPPAHDAMNGGYRTALDGCRQGCAVFGVQPGRWTRGLAINQPLRPLRIEPQHPVADDLQTDTADAGGFATTAAVVDHRQRQQSACLICVPRIPRQLTQLRSREVRAECYR
jgi:hypothetical protein